MQRISAWSIPAAGGGGAGAGRAPFTFKDVVPSRDGNQLKLKGKGLVPASVAAISAEVLRAFPGAEPIGLQLRGASRSRAPARAPPPRAARSGLRRGFGGARRTHSRSLPAPSLYAGHAGGEKPWIVCSWGLPGAPPLGFVLGIQQGTSASSFQVDEGSGTNATFFNAVFGAVAGSRRFIVLKPAVGSLVAVNLPFVQSKRSDTASVVSATTTGHASCVFVCTQLGAGKAAGEGFKGVAAGAGGASSAAPK